jgi:hypothetical protein
MITLTETKHIRPLKLDSTWSEAARGVGISATSAYETQPSMLLAKVTSTADIVGEGRALGTQLGVLDFVGERVAYTGEASREFEFKGLGTVTTVGGSAREIPLSGVAQADERTPFVHRFRGNVVLEESYSWADMPSLFQVQGLIKPAKRRSRHMPPSRAYNAFTELATWLEMSHDELAKIIDVSRTTVSMSWKKGVEPHNKAQARRVYELHSVVAALHTTLGPDLTGWLKKGRPCPLALLEQRKYERFERRADEVVFATARPPRPRLDTASDPQPSLRTAPEAVTRLKPAGRARSKRLAR